MWRFMPSWLTPLESDRGTRTTDDAPTLPYEHGVPVSSDSAVQAPTERPPAPGDRRASVARQLTNLSEMMSMNLNLMSNLMADLRREDSEHFDDVEPENVPSDIRREIYGDPPPMPALDPNEESDSELPSTGTTEPDGQHTILFRDSQANIDETRVVGTNVLPTTTPIVVRFTDSRQSDTENTVPICVGASPTAATTTTTTTLTWTSGTIMATSGTGPLAAASRSKNIDSVEGMFYSSAPHVRFENHPETRMSFPQSPIMPSNDPGMHYHEQYEDYLGPQQHQVNNNHLDRGTSYRYTAAVNRLDRESSPYRYQANAAHRDGGSTYHSTTPVTRLDRETSPYKYQANAAHRDGGSTYLPTAPVTRLDRESSPYRYQANAAYRGGGSTYHSTTPVTRLDRETSPHRYQAHAAYPDGGSTYRHSEAVNRRDRESSPYRYQANADYPDGGSMYRPTTLVNRLDRESSPHRYQANAAYSDGGSTYRATTPVNRLDRESSPYRYEANAAYPDGGSTYRPTAQVNHLDRETSPYRYEANAAYPDGGSTYRPTAQVNHLDRETSPYRYQANAAYPDGGSTYRPTTLVNRLDRESSPHRHQAHAAYPNGGSTYHHTAPVTRQDRESSPHRYLAHAAYPEGGSTYRKTVAGNRIDRESYSHQYQASVACPDRGSTYHPSAPVTRLDRESSPHRYQVNVAHREGGSTYHASAPVTRLDRESSPHRYQVNVAHQDGGSTYHPTAPVTRLNRESSPHQHQANAAYSDGGSTYRHAAPVNRLDRESSPYRYQGNAASSGPAATLHHELPRPRLEREAPSSRHQVNVDGAASPGNSVTRQLSTGSHLDGGAPVPPRISLSQTGEVTQGISSKPKKVHTYDGKSSWTDYLVQFNITATMNGWNESQKAMELATNLVGVARGVLSEISEEGQLNFGQLVEKLTARFEPKDLTGMHQTELRTRRRKRNETIPELVQAINRLVRKAFPTADESTRNYMGVSSFISALNNDQHEMFVFQRDPQNVEEAGRAAMAYETFQSSKPKTGPPYVRAQNIEGTAPTSPGRSPSGLAGRVAKLEKSLLQNRNQQNANSSEGVSPSGPCFNCNQTGHWRNECPELRPNLNAGSSSSASNRTGIQQCPICQKARHGISVCPERYSRRPCHNCGQFGHWRNECPEQPRHSGNDNRSSNLENGSGNSPPVAAGSGTPVPGNAQ